MTSQRTHHIFLREELLGHAVFFNANIPASVTFIPNQNFLIPKANAQKLYHYKSVNFTLSIDEGSLITTKAYSLFHLFSYPNASAINPLNCSGHL